MRSVIFRNGYEIKIDFGWFTADSDQFLWTKACWKGVNGCTNIHEQAGITIKCPCGCDIRFCI